MSGDSQAARSQPAPASLDCTTDPAFLTAVLRDAGTLAGEREIRSVRRDRLGEGAGIGAELYRLIVTDDVGAVQTLVSKGPLTSELRALAEASGIYQRELAFYSMLAPSCPLATPAVYFADAVGVGSDFVILLEDLDARPGLTPGNQIQGLDRASLQAVLPQLDQFHRWSQELDPADRASFPTLAEIVAPLAPLVPTGWEIYRSIGRDMVPAHLDEFVRAFGEVVLPILAGLDDDTTLIHGDMRADNLFRDTNGGFVVIDFQGVCRAPALADVAYLATQSMAQPLHVDEHRSLVESHRTVSSERWNTYRRAAAAYLFIPALAMLTLGTANERGRTMALTLMQRWLTAAETLEVVTLV